MTQSYTYQYHTYPVFAEEVSYEGAIKRFTHMPDPKNVYDFALLGMPKFFPLTNEPITVDMAAPYLESAITEIEMSLGCNISEVDHYEIFDYVDGMFNNNFMGLKLTRWPATQIIEVSLKYPHAGTQSVYQKYTIPSGWVLLSKNKVNIVASMGTVYPQTNSAALSNLGGIFSFIAGVSRGAYQPGAIEVVYKAGFTPEKMPSSMADLIKTWAAHRFLTDLIPAISPSSGVSVSIDGVAQSTSLNVYQALMARVELLEKKKNELSASLVKQFGRTIKTTFIGA